MYARHADFLAACVGQGFEMVSKCLHLAKRYAHSSVL